MLGENAKNIGKWRVWFSWHALRYQKYYALCSSLWIVKIIFLHLTTKTEMILRWIFPFSYDCDGSCYQSVVSKGISFYYFRWLRSRLCQQTSGRQIGASSLKKLYLIRGCFIAYQLVTSVCFEWFPVTVCSFLDGRSMFTQLWLTFDVGEDFFVLVYWVPSIAMINSNPLQFDCWKDNL